MAISSNTAKAASPAETILVADDDVLARIVIGQYLRHCGYRVIEAVSAGEALVLLQHPGLIVDVVLAALKLPGAMDGFLLAQWIRQNKPAIDVILVGSTQRAADVAANLCETGPTLTKPYEPQLVVDRIARLRTLRQRKSH